jgi:hypothetical protein
VSADDVTPVLDIRIYRLAPGARDEFDCILRTEALPLLERFGISVVAFGPSLADERGYALVRSFVSVTEREAKLGAFYGSREWLERFDDRVGALIDEYHVVVVEAPAHTGAE